jgi:hypothetical protein
MSIDPATVLIGKPHNPVVYFIRLGDSVKIGTSKNLSGRLNTLSLRPQNVMLLLPGDWKIEHEYHDRFRQHWIQGEWFRYVGSLKTFINYGISEPKAKIPDNVEIPNNRVTIRQATELGIIPITYDALKKRRQRNSDFPKGYYTEFGTAYNITDLIEWWNAA